MCTALWVRRQWRLRRGNKQFLPIVVPYNKLDAADGTADPRTLVKVTAQAQGLQKLGLNQLPAYHHNSCHALVVCVPVRALDDVVDLMNRLHTHAKVSDVKRGERRIASANQMSGKWHSLM